MIDREITIWTDGRTDGQTYGQVVRQVNIAPAMHFFLVIRFHAMTQIRKTKKKRIFSHKPLFMIHSNKQKKTADSYGFLSILTLIFVLKRNTKRNAVQKVQKHGRLLK